MSMRSSSLANNPLAVTRELDGRYDVVLEVRDSLNLIEQVAGVDFATILAELEAAQDFTGITVVQGETVAWDAVNKVLTVPKGGQGISIHHLKGTSTTNPHGDFGTSPFKDTYTFYGDADETLNLGWFVVNNGAGMTATVYDTNKNGVVDNSERLGGELPSHYVNVVDNQVELALKADATTVTTGLATKINNSEKGVANGVATLDVNGKVVLTQMPDSILGQLEYVGTWNFTTMPTATQKGQYWIANVSGNGYVVGDWAVWNGVAFDKVDNTDAVASVAGRTGNVVLTKTDVGLANVDNTADNVKNVLSATKWTTARTLSLTGDASGSAYFDGSSDIDINVSVSDNSHNHTISNITGLSLLNLDRADKYLSAQNIANMIYVGDDLTKIQYNTATDIDYEILTYGVVCYI